MVKAMHLAILSLLVASCNALPPSEGVNAYYCPPGFCLSKTIAPDRKETPVTCIKGESGLESISTAVPKPSGPLDESSYRTLRLVPNASVVELFRAVASYRAYIPIIEPETGWPLAQCCTVYSDTCPQRNGDTIWAPAQNLRRTRLPSLPGIRDRFASLRTVERGSLADRILVRFTAHP
jgi:hypothetical protein